MNAQLLFDKGWFRDCRHEQPERILFTHENIRFCGVSDNVRERIASLLPGRKGQWGRIARDNRLFINAVFWIVTLAGLTALIMATGKTPIVASVAGATRACGYSCLKT